MIRSRTLRPGRAGEHPPRAASARPATPARSWARVRVSADSEFPRITGLEFPTLAERSQVYG